MFMIMVSVSCFGASIGGMKIANRGTAALVLVSAPAGLCPSDVGQAETIPKNVTCIRNLDERGISNWSMR
jgi:hypothetical protein